MTDQLNDCGEMEDLDESVKNKVRKLVCANAKGRSHKQKVTDASELLAMLGLHPASPEEPTLSPSRTINHFV